LTNTTDALTGRYFDRPGRFTYTVTERGGGTTTTNPPHTLANSPAVYELSIYVRLASDGLTHEVFAHTIVVRAQDSLRDMPPLTAVGDKPEYGMLFTNNLTMTAGTATHPALSIQKAVTGEFGDRGKLFDFTLVLQANTLSPLNLPIAFQVFNAAGAVDATRSGTITALSPPLEFQLRHGERFVIQTLPIGTSYTATERAARDYRASVTITSGQSTDTITNPDTNMDLSTGSRQIALTDAQNRNEARFTNNAEIVVGTGLGTHIPASGLIFLSFPLVALSAFASRKRKSIEKLATLALENKV
jgi:hypothetical protein